MSLQSLVDQTRAVLHWVLEGLKRLGRSILGTSTTTTELCRFVRIPDYWEPQSVYFIELDEFGLVAGRKRAASSASDCRSADTGCKRKKG